jgi:hypothetical protein
MSFGSRSECEPKIEPIRLANDLGRKAITGVTEFGHPYVLTRFGECRKLTYRDKAFQFVDSCLPPHGARVISKR